MRNHNGYDEYMGQLKGLNPRFDDGRMYSGIKTRMKKKARTGNLLMVSLLIFILMGSISYYNLFPFSSNTGTELMDYVFQNDNSGNDPVSSYVFMN
jgi:hypothetical protein